MEGVILHYDETTKKGVLKDHNGARFEFSDRDWKSNESLRTGLKVDFVAKDSSASEIYSVANSNLSGNIAGKISDIQGSPLGQKINSLFICGMHNKLGFFASIAVLITLYLPIVQISFLGKVSLINYGYSKLLFILLIVLASFFYGGATRLYIYVLTGVVLVIILFQYYDLFSGLSSANNFMNMLGGVSKNAPKFSNIQWGAFVNIIAIGVLAFATYFKGYKNNINTI